MANTVITIQDSADLEKRLADAGEALVVIDFFATWCGPCKMIGPQLIELAAQSPDIIFLKVDVDECEDIAAKYDISSMPTFIFIKKGEVVHQFSGASLDKLKQGIEAHNK